MNEDEVRLLDDLCARAWTPLEWQEEEGWVLRAANGISLRANSVWPRAALGETPLATRIERAERFYRERGLPARFQLSPASAPAGLEEALQARGYRVHTATDVMVCAIAGTRTSPAVTLAQGVTEEWRRIMVGGAADPADAAGRLAIVDGIRLARRHALARREGAAAAIGLGVVDRGWLGIYAMRTLPAHRRRGLARSIVAALLHWAAGEGATRAYLQVETDNPGAIALYRALDFTREYGYRYWSRH